MKKLLLLISFFVLVPAVHAETLTITPDEDPGYYTASGYGSTIFTYCSDTGELIDQGTVGQFEFPYQLGVCESLLIIGFDHTDVEAPATPIFDEGNLTMWNTYSAVKSSFTTYEVPYAEAEYVFPEGATIPEPPETLAIMYGEDPGYYTASGYGSTIFTYCSDTGELIDQGTVGTFEFPQYTGLCGSLLLIGFDHADVEAPATPIFDEENEAMWDTYDAVKDSFDTYEIVYAEASYVFTEPAETLTITPDEDPGYYTASGYGSTIFTYCSDTGELVDQGTAGQFEFPQYIGVCESLLIIGFDHTDVEAPATPIFDSGNEALWNTYSAVKSSFTTYEVPYAEAEYVFPEPEL